MESIDNDHGETFKVGTRVRFPAGRFNGRLGFVTDIDESPVQGKPYVRIRLITSGENTKGIWYSANSVTLDLIPVCHE